MPLLDHFNPPLSHTHPWRSFHGTWAVKMADLLNHGVLPHGYYAVPFVAFAGSVEIDVATFPERGATEGTEASAAAQTWAPPAPSLALAVELPAVDTIELQVFSDEGEGHPTAAVELVSPRNKDRPTARQAFAVKCVNYLQQGTGIVVVDLVTTRRADLHTAILSLVDREPEPDTLPPGLSAVSYHAIYTEREQQQLLLWPAALALGEPLPTLPLWIAADLAVPLDLDTSYRAACEALLIHEVG